MLTRAIRGTLRWAQLPSLRLRSAFNTSARTSKKKPSSYRPHQIDVLPRGRVNKLTPTKYQQPYLYEISIPRKAAELPRWRRRRYQILGSAVAGLGFFWWTYQEQVPITGRWRFNFMSNLLLKWDQADYPGTIKEIEGAILPEKHPIAGTVGRVLDRLLSSSGLEHLDWKVHVVKAPDIVNASVSPSGKVMVYTGILPICQDESGIATVLSHEIGHVIASHSAEMASSLLFFGIASIPTWPVMGLAAMGLIIEELVAICAIYLLPIIGAGAFFSRKRESEADYIGLVIMAKAGYDIERSVAFWERMKEEGTRKLEQKDETGKLKHQAPPQLLSTHPHDADRIAQIKKWIPQILKLTEVALNAE